MRVRLYIGRGFEITERQFFKQKTGCICLAAYLELKNLFQVNKS